jgi:hypothetical protein
MVSKRRKPARKAAPRKPRTRTLTLRARVGALEAAVFFPKVPAAPKALARFVKLDAKGNPTTGDHVAVHDSKTGLTWSAGPLQDGKDFTHADALKACTALSLAGHSDWRAPTIEELLSIVDYSRHSPAVSDVFKGPYGWTWSSTVDASNPSGDAWSVFLHGGYSDRYSQSGRIHVRAVRAGQSPQALG